MSTSQIAEDNQRKRENEKYFINPLSIHPDSDTSGAVRQGRFGADFFEEK